MTGEVLRNGWPAVRRKIVRCQQTLRLAEPPELHGTVYERAEAQRDIRALPDEIDAFIGLAEVDADIGIAVLEGKDQPADVQETRIVPEGAPRAALASLPACSAHSR